MFRDLNIRKNKRLSNIKTEIMKYYNDAEVDLKKSWSKFFLLAYEKNEVKYGKCEHRLWNTVSLNQGGANLGLWVDVLCSSTLECGATPELQTDFALLYDTALH